MNTVKTKLLGLICLLSCVAFVGCAGEHTVVQEPAADAVSTDAERLEEAKAYVTEVLDEPDPGLRALVSTTREHGEQLETSSSWDDAPIKCKWNLSRHPTAESPCVLMVQLPSTVTDTNVSAAVMKGWSSLSPQPVFGAEVTIMKLIDGLIDNEKSDANVSGWKYLAARDGNREFSIQFWREGELEVVSDLDHELPIGASWIFFRSGNGAIDSKSPEFYLPKSHAIVMGISDPAFRVGTVTVNGVGEGYRGGQLSVIGQSAPNDVVVKYFNDDESGQAVADIQFARGKWFAAVIGLSDANPSGELLDGIAKAAISKASWPAKTEFTR